MVSSLKKAEKLDDQDVWRSVHAEAAAAGLDADGIQVLRRWAGDRMKNFAFAVYQGGFRYMRFSFVEAIRHAAADIKAGKVPE